MPSDFPLLGKFSCGRSGAAPDLEEQDPEGSTPRWELDCGYMHNCSKEAYTHNSVLKKTIEFSLS